MAEGSLNRSIRILQYCIDNYNSYSRPENKFRISAVIEGILIANDLLDNELEFKYHDITETRYSIFLSRRTYTRKETYKELMLRLANEAIPILMDRQKATC